MGLKEPQRANTTRILGSALALELDQPLKAAELLESSRRSLLVEERDSSIIRACFCKLRPLSKIQF